MKLEKFDADAAKSQIERLEQTSAVLASSAPYNELGSSAEGDDSVTSEIVSEVTKIDEALEKTDAGTTPEGTIKAISSLMKKKGAGHYNQYLNEQRQRTRLA